MSKILIFIISIIIFFLLGLLTEHYNPFPYSSVKFHIKNILTKSNFKIDDYGYSVCDFESISVKNFHLKHNKDQTLIVGHIYTADKNDNYINTFEDFISIENIQFKNTLLLGDIFLEPSVSKWNLLIYDIRKISQNMYLVPGNHDVGDKENTKRDIFFQLFDTLPMYVKKNNYDLIMLDSTIGNSFLNETQINFILNKMKKNNNKKNLFIATHHLLRPGSKKISNQPIVNHKGLMQIINKEIKNLKIKYKNIFFLAGDLGNNKNFDCIEKDNIHFISVGLSGNKNDIVLVYDNISNKFFKVSLSGNKE